MKQMLTLSVSFFLVMSVASAWASPTSNKENSACRCQPNQSCWPNKKAWSGLAKVLSGRLMKQPVSPIAPCRKNVNSKACAKAFQLVKNPFYLQSIPGGSQSQGVWKAWTYKNSEYAVEVENTKDIVAAVNFARQHHLRLVIKGAGHDYLGRSNAPDSLLIWTHHLRKLKYHPSFTPAGAPAGTKGVTAMTVGAGVDWLSVYQKAAKYGQYVQGGDCTSVGAVGGFTLGGGFGAWSKKYGTGAANLLQATVVMADGRVLTANAYQNKDLFWALRGGGPGFGVVTQMTYRTYPLPQYFGFVNATIVANSDADYKQLVKHLFVFLRGHIINQHWGGNVNFYANNTIGLEISSEGLTQKSETVIWLPYLKWVKSQPKRFTLEISMSQMPAKYRWNTAFYEKHTPQEITLDNRPGAPKGQWWRSSENWEVYRYWTTFQSWWLPVDLFKKGNVDRLTRVLFKASRYISLNGGMILQLSKGLAGAAPAAIQRTHQTSMNPAVYNAAGLIVIAGGYPGTYPGVKGHTPSSRVRQLNGGLRAMNRAMGIIKKAAPNAGSYVNETSYFQPHWQTVFWGANYPKLLKIKQKVDPNGLFYCHHCVGSEFWQPGGMCRVPSKRVTALR